LISAPQRGCYLDYWFVANSGGKTGLCSKVAQLILDYNECLAQIIADFSATTLNQAGTKFWFAFFWKDEQDERLVGGSSKSYS
jgi:hypothetical protein